MPITSVPSVFDLAAGPPAKRVPALLSLDEEHLRAIAAALDDAVSSLTARLDDVRRTTGGEGQEALDRDQEVRRLSERLRLLQRFSLDHCLGRMVHEDGRIDYIGRVGLSDRDGRRLLLDWRTPAAEPFFAATHTRPGGLVSRRRYRWTGGRITDYWDELFVVPEDGAALPPVALDDQSAFLAGLGASRSGQMRDVLATIQADQDAIIRADSRGTLVVDGGPGTGKTVVALHRAAYLLYADPRLNHRRGGVLFVGPHQPYLAYIADVLPSLGQEGVQTCTLPDLVGGSVGERAGDLPEEEEPLVVALKQRAEMVAAIEPAVALYEEPPGEGLLVETPWLDLWVSVADWAEAFGAADPDTPHNEAREEIRRALVEVLVDKAMAELEDRDDEGGEGGEGRVSRDQLHRGLLRHGPLRRALDRAWPMLEPTDLVGDLWEVPAYLRRCAPWLDVDEIRLLQREDPHAWTLADLPLLDAARLRLGDPDASRREQRRVAQLATQRVEMEQVVEHLVASDDSEMQVMSMLKVDDLGAALVDESGVRTADPDALAGPFAHIVVDEAQELTDAEWQMLIARCPSRSFTVVGDRAQARHGFAETWVERLERAGLHDIELRTLTVNYRTPAQVMAAAEPVIRAAIPDANVPTSIRTDGTPVRHGAVDDLLPILTAWLAEHEDGTACVIGTIQPAPYADVLPDRVRALTPVLAKGLEFDLVVVVEPEAFGDGIEGAVERYVAMTRATQELVILSA